MSEPTELRDRIRDEVSGIQIGTGYYAQTIGIDGGREVADAILPLVEGRIAEAVAAERERSPVYLALDLWQALGLPVGAFDGYYERNRWAETWSALLHAVRELSGRDVCPIVMSGEPCALINGHVGPHMGDSDVGSSEPLPAAAIRTTKKEES